ncbi:hypothetical protein, partial [Polaromonas sp.]|uniref:hypothetical protein n=1 Tax=Polaromonas sp. TaxID=1869339 RepID=UPI0024890C2A
RSPNLYGFIPTPVHYAPDLNKANKIDGKSIVDWAKVKSSMQKGSKTGVLKPFEAVLSPS